jgi:hypothetical protein
VPQVVTALWVSCWRDAEVYLFLSLPPTYSIEVPILIAGGRQTSTFFEKSKMTSSAGEGAVNASVSSSMGDDVAVCKERLVGDV